MMNDSQGDFPCYSVDESPFPLGSEEFNLILKDENLFENCLHPEMGGHYSEISYFNPPDTTMVLSNVPHPTSRLPSMEDYPGPFNFDMDFNRPDWDRGKWEFSKALNKIYAAMKCKVPLLFKWDQQELGLYVRALPVFLDQNYYEEPVRRCAMHVSALEESNKDFQYVDHIMRCDHASTVYEKNPESGRYSVRVPLDRSQPGADGTTIVYTFMCKNSCCVGMNRRSTGIIFTLERENGEVVGRKMIKLRICSCPRRDVQKEEKDLMEKENKNEDIIILPAGKKPIKRLAKQKDMINLHIRLPGSMEKFASSIATMVKEAILLKSELTPSDEIALEDCDKYL